MLSPHRDFKTQVSANNTCLVGKRTISNCVHGVFQQGMRWGSTNQGRECGAKYREGAQTCSEAKDFNSLNMGDTYAREGTSEGEFRRSHHLYLYLYL